MTNPMFNPQPNYSGVTIQIANPSVYANGSGPQIQQGRMCNPNSNIYCPSPSYSQGITVPNCITETNPTGLITGYQQPQLSQNYIPQQPIAYPPQYYLNNYNYQNFPTSVGKENSLTDENKKLKYISLYSFFIFL